MSRWVRNNHLRLLENGQAYFPRLIEAIDHAKHEIYFETYIYSADKIGLEVAEHLKIAARRGVRVFLTIDGVGSPDLPKKFIEDLRHHGVSVFIFRPWERLFQLGKRIIRRLHRKMVVIDQKIAFVGGMNITEDQIQSESKETRLDFSVEVAGPLCQRIHRIAKLFALRLRRRWVEYLIFRKTKKGIPLPEGHMKAAIITRDNIRSRMAIEKEYLYSIYRAKKEIIISNAYFLPGFRFRRAIRDARRRQVEVILLLQGIPEVRVIHYATQHLYKEFITMGVKIYEYQKSWMHAKVAVIDEKWSTVGSCNLDPLSLFLNLEANVFCLDDSFSKHLADRLKFHATTHATLIDAAHLRKVSVFLGFRNRLCLWLFRFFKWFSEAPDKDQI